MEIKLNVCINDSLVDIQFEDEQGSIKIFDSNNTDYNTGKTTLYLLFNNKLIKDINQTIDKSEDFDKIIEISVPEKINLEYLEYILVEETIKNKVKLVSKKKITEPKISDKQKDDTNEYKDKILYILSKFGYELFKVNENTKVHSEKARHKWTKEISQIKFTAKSKGGEGIAIWKSRNELVLLSGAKLVNDPQLNKDGTKNFSAQLAEKVRSDHSDKIVNNITTEDIVFPSPNILGIFLFFGGQNTWLELKDENGKSLDEWSRID